MAQKIAAFLNDDSGTLKNTDDRQLQARIRHAFEGKGYMLDFFVASGKDLIGIIEEKAAAPNYDILLVAGGDGTVSFAAAQAFKHDKILAALPAGTMNLFARSLAMPLDLVEAIDALASGNERRVDIATANGRPFVHQFSIGLHPDTISRRKAYDYRSRIGKIVASVRAYFDAVAHMPLYHLTVTRGETVTRHKVSQLSVSNNLFGANRPPFAEKPDGGVLGLYMAGDLTRQQALALGADAILGQMDQNEDLMTGKLCAVRLDFSKMPGKAKCALDGELLPLSRTVEIKIHPGALRVLAPAIAGM